MQIIVGAMIPAILVVLTNLAPPGSPGPQDSWSVLGAMIASVIIMHRETRGTNFWRTPMLSSFLTSSFIGSIGPGLLINTVLPWMFTDFSSKWGMMITWHGWAGLGLLFGLSGGYIVRGWLAISQWIPWKMEERANRWIGKPDRKQSDDEDTP